MRYAMICLFALALLAGTAFAEFRITKDRNDTGQFSCAKKEMDYIESENKNFD